MASTRFPSRRSRKVSSHSDRTHGPDPLARALSGRLRGEVSTDEKTLRFYSNAACLYEIRPRAVVWPRDEEDVEALIAVCREENVPITARGAGSAVAGQALGRGVIADFTRHMNLLLEVKPEEGWARVQPGLVLGALNEALGPFGKHFPPDPSSAAFCTLGGMIANNAGGPHSVRYGSTRDYLLSLTAFTGSGSQLVTRSLTPPGAGQAGGAGQVGGAGESAAGAGEKSGKKGDENERLAQGLLAIVEGCEELLRRHAIRTSRNSSGYDLPGALRDGGVDLGRLLVGSEGTLALVTEATLKVTDLPRARGTALLLFDDLRQAGEAIVEALSEVPSCVELMSESLLRMLRAENAAVRSAVPVSTRAVVILECDGDSPAEAAAGLERVRQRVAVRRGLASSFHAVTEPSARAEIWSVRSAATLILTAREGKRRNMRFIEDACVPPARLVEFIESLTALLVREGLEAAIFGHAGDSLIHVNPLMDPKDTRLRERMEAIASAFTDLVIRCGGTLTGEHGDGRLRTPFLPRRFGPVYELFREVKRLFDPSGILNPDIITAAGAYRLTDNLRSGPSLWQVPAPAMRQAE